jgi:hypothetical protein
LRGSSFGPKCRRVPAADKRRGVGGADKKKFGARAQPTPAGRGENFTDALERARRVGEVYSIDAWKRGRRVGGAALLITVSGSSELISPIGMEDKSSVSPAQRHGC